MNQIEIEPIGLQARQAFIHLPQNVLSREAAVVRSRSDTIEHLRAQKQLLSGGGAFRLQPSADIGLAAAAAVRIGGVEEIDARVVRVIHQRGRLRLVFALSEKRRRRADAPEVATAEPKARYVQAG